MRWTLVVLAPLLLLLAACTGEDVSSRAQASPTPAAAAQSVLLPPTPIALPETSPSPTPTVTPTPPPTPTSTPTQPPEPTPTFEPGPVILPIDPIPTRTPTAVPADPLARRLDGVGLRVNVLRGLTSQRSVEREFITRQEAAVRLRGYYDEDREEIYEDERLYATLGILERGTDLFELLLGLQTEGVLGFYDSEEEKLYVVQGDDGEFGPADVTTYVHELVHGLQQQHFDIHATFEGLRDNSDAARAFRALVEGDATLAESAYLFEHMDEEERAAAQQESSDALIQAFNAVPYVIKRTYIYPYREGLNFVVSLYGTDGWDAVTQAFDDLPQSTEQVLHPERYVDRDEPVGVEIPVLINVLGDEWSLVRRDVLGEFMIQAYLEAEISPQDAYFAAEGWGGDAYAVLSGPQDASLLVLRIAWDTEEDAGEFFEAFVEFTRVRTGAQWEATGDGATARLMTLADQSIFVDMDALKTTLIFAPDGPTLESVRGVLGQGIPAP